MCVFFFFFELHWFLIGKYLNREKKEEEEEEKGKNRDAERQPARKWQRQAQLLHHGAKLALLWTPSGLICQETWPCQDA